MRAVLVLLALLSLALARIVVLGPSLANSPISCVAANIGSTAIRPRNYTYANISYNAVAVGRIVNSIDARDDLRGAVVMFDLSWRNVNIADELERVTALNASAALITSTLSTIFLALRAFPISNSPALLLPTFPLAAPGRAVALLKERYNHQRTFQKVFEILPVYQVSSHDCQRILTLTMPKSRANLTVIVEKESTSSPLLSKDVRLCYHCVS